MRRGPALYSMKYVRMCILHDLLTDARCARAFTRTEAEEDVIAPPNPEDTKANRRQAIRPGHDP